MISVDDHRRVEFGNSGCERSSLRRRCSTSARSGKTGRAARRRLRLDTWILQLDGQCLRLVAGPLPATSSSQRTLCARAMEASSWAVVFHPRSLALDVLQGAGVRACPSSVIRLDVDRILQFLIPPVSAFARFLRFRASTFSNVPGSSEKEAAPTHSFD